MNRNRPFGGLAVLAMLLCLPAAGTACAGQERKWDPVDFGTPSPAGTALPIRVDEDDVMGAARWPSACRFLTDNEIRTLLPQAEEIERKPTPVSVLSFDEEQREQASEGSCRFEFWLRNVTIKDVTSGVKVSIVGIADPSIIGDHYSEELASAKTRSDRDPAVDLGASLGPEACYTWRETSKLFPVVVCRQGPLMYDVSGTGYGDMEGVPEDDLVAQGESWRDKVLIPVAQIIASKVPAATGG
ncbi:hypothetical protein I0C86_28810 [Plantactinospora sp. S1510]|uniref:DUF3558 domain-containing protein n=1 Tax=Plantactinospora alkalitolerans TaxID=2789879 RepID=A0ABS0H387_9ACTN|nr:hypothetical protein [Plantactinospora alkalitolerans]MBF9132930.1 hypothetical protein [Plantactinospora alkalitolerans]